MSEGSLVVDSPLGTLHVRRPVALSFNLRRVPVWTSMWSILRVGQLRKLDLSLGDGRDITKF